MCKILIPMKNKLLLLMSALILLASCSTKIGLVKRKYNKGFYVSVTKKHPDAPQQTNRETKSALAKVHRTEKEVLVKETNAVEPTLNQKSDNVVASSNTTKQTTQQRTEPLKKQNKQINKQVTAEPLVTASAKKSPESTKLSKFKTLANMTLGANKAKESDTDKILWVILCIIPPLGLIAIYLHDGRITLNFWISLLLYLTILGGIIFSILVVLDIINLA